MAKMKRKVGGRGGSAKMRRRIAGYAKARATNLEKRSLGGRGGFLGLGRGGLFGGPDTREKEYDSLGVNKS